MVDADLFLRRYSETLKHVYSSRIGFGRVDSTTKADEMGFGCLRVSTRK